MVSPVPVWIILAGFIVGGVSRGLLVGVIVTGVALFFTDLHITHPALTVGLAILTAILFSIAGLINALFANSFDDISIIPTFILTPLTYLGGVFYSISLLPEFWQKASLVNPILYMVNAFRYGFLGVSDISLALSYTISIGFIVILYVFSLYLLRKGHGIRT